MATKGKPTDISRAYLLKGDDDFRKARELEKLVKLLVADDFVDFDLEHLEGDTATSDRVMAGLNIPPFGPGRRVVLVKYANKMDPDEQEKLAPRLEKIPQSGCLILVNPAAEKTDGKPKRGSEVIGELSKAVRKVGEIREFGGERGREKTARSLEFAKTLFATAGKQIGSDALSLFAQRAGSDFSVLDSEARKLIDYSGDNDTITVRDVSAVTSETPEEKVFKLTDAVGQRNKALALKLLHELFEAGSSPDADAPKTLSNLARQFRLIWQVKMLADAGVRSFARDNVPEGIRRDLPSTPNLLDVVARQSWQADKLTRQARHFSRKDLARCFAAIARADAMLKGAAGNIEDPKLVMEILVTELASGSAARR